MIRRFAVAAAVLSLASPSLAAGDAENGAKIFRKCQACHKIGDGAANGVGPALTGIVGRKAGSVEGYTYSTLNKSASDLGLVWTEEALIKYLPDPGAFLKHFVTEKGKPDLAVGATKMPFKLPDEAERTDLVAYLKTFSK